METSLLSRSRRVKASRRALAVPIRDGAPEIVSDPRDVAPLEVQDRSTEFVVAKDVLDPASEVPANQMTLHHIVWQRRQRR